MEESEGEGKRKEREKGRKNEFPVREPGFFLGWKQTQSVLGACPVLPQRPSEWFSAGMQAMVGGAEREGQALSRWPSPVVEGGKGGNSPSLHMCLDFSWQLKMSLC